MITSGAEPFLLPGGSKGVLLIQTRLYCIRCALSWSWYDCRRNG